MFCVIPILKIHHSKICFCLVYSPWLRFQKCFEGHWRFIALTSHFFILHCSVSCSCMQKDLYGANVIIFEGIMAFVYPELREVPQHPLFSC